MNKNRIRQMAVIFMVVATIVINALADILPINGLGTGQISDKFKVFFVPAGYVFSIWGLIYVGLMAYAVFQALPSQRENPRLQATAGLFFIGSLANCAWIFLWHYELFVWTLAAMFTLLITLILMYVKLEIGRNPVSRAETWSVRVPFSIYLGWITVATIANVTDVLNYLNWSGWGIAPQAWAAIMLAVAVLVAGLMAITRHDVAYLLVLVWAFTGIAVKFQLVPAVATPAWAASIATGLFVLLVFVMKHIPQRIN